MPNREVSIHSPAGAGIAWARRRLAGDASLALVDQLVPGGGVAIDAGAEHGLFTARMAQLVGRGGTVHAFEPNPECVRDLREIARVEPNTHVHAVALSDQGGGASLHVPLRDGRPVAAVGSLEPPADVECETIAVETARLDDVLGDEAARVSFVKVDVEGHELAVLRGAVRTLSDAGPALLVEIERRHAGGRMEATFDFLAGLGYEAFAVGAEGPVPLVDFDVERDQLAFLDGGFDTGTMPRGYVNDFLFTREKA